MNNENNQKAPKVSVLLPSYNHVDFIETCIESVLNQTYRNFEFIIADDASTDGTVEKILKYEKEIDEIHLFDENSGTLGGFLCERAKGDYIAIINSDDVWSFDKLEKQMQILQEHPTAVGCFTWCEMIDEDGNILDRQNPFNVQNRKKEQWLNYFYYQGNCFAHASVLMRKDVYCKYREKHINMFRQIPDFYLWIKMVQEHEVIMLEEKLTYIRVVNKNERINVSAATRDNLVRHFNEECFVWYQEIANMDEVYFKRAFQEQLIDKNAEGRIEIMCEKFFVLLQAKIEYCKLAAFFYFYENYAEMQEVLFERYGFTNKDFHQLVANIGPSNFVR